MRVKNVHTCVAVKSRLAIHLEEVKYIFRVADAAHVTLSANGNGSSSFGLVP
jgi:hypothetical protein